MVLSVAESLSLAETMIDLLTIGRCLTVSKDDEGEFTASISGPSKHSAASTLEGVLQELTPHPPRKKCLRCGSPKPLWTFGPDADGVDGRSSTCKSCESKRVGKHAKRKSKMASTAKDHLNGTGIFNGNGTGGLAANHVDESIEALGGVELPVDPHMGKGLQDVDG